MNGHTTIIERLDDNSILWLYKEDGSSVLDENLDIIYKECPKCGKLPINGQDACIANLPGVSYACCGHGVSKGYVQFTNGVVIRGRFDEGVEDGHKNM